MKIPKNNISLTNVALYFGNIYEKNGEKFIDTRLSTLCKSPGINMWAKYKPVDNDFSENRPAEWWRGREGNCGIEVQKNMTLPQLETAVEDYKNVYKYIRPQGGFNSPYRLGDFAGYNSNALPPIFMDLKDGMQFPLKGVSKITFMLISQIASEDSLSVTDVFGGNFFGSDIYYAVALRRKGTTDWKYMTSAKPFKEGSNTTQLDYPTSGLSTGFYETIQFLTTGRAVNYPQIGSPGQCVPIPIFGDIKDYIQTIEFVYTNLYIGLSNIWIRKPEPWKSLLTLDINIQDTSGASHHFTNCSIQWRYGDSKPLDAFVRGEGKQDIKDIDTLGGTDNYKEHIEIEIPGVILPPREDDIYGNKYDNSRWIYFYANNQLQAKSMMMEMLPPQEVTYSVIK